MNTAPGCWCWMRDIPTGARSTWVVYAIICPWDYMDLSPRGSRGEFRRPTETAAGPDTRYRGPRAGLFDEPLALQPVVGDVGRVLTDDLMQDLNARVDIDGEDPADVAYDWLKNEGLVE